MPKTLTAETPFDPAAGGMREEVTGNRESGTPTEECRPPRALSLHPLDAPVLRPALFRFVRGYGRDGADARCLKTRGLLGGGAEDEVGEGADEGGRVVQGGHQLEPREAETIG